MRDKKYFDNIYFEFLILKEIFFALQASFTSYSSFFNIGSIDNEIDTKSPISSISILNIFSGAHNCFIVSEIPYYTSCARIYNCYIAYNYKFYSNINSIYIVVHKTVY